MKNIFIPIFKKRHIGLKTAHHKIEERKKLANHKIEKEKSSIPVVKTAFRPKTAHEA